MRYGLHTAAGLAAVAAMTAIAAPAAAQGLTDTETLNVGAELASAREITVQTLSGADTVSFTGLEFTLVEPQVGERFRLGFIDAGYILQNSGGPNQTTCTLDTGLEAGSDQGSLQADTAAATVVSDVAILEVLGDTDAQVIIEFGAGVDTANNQVDITSGSSTIAFKPSTTEGFAVLDADGEVALASGFGASSGDRTRTLDSNGFMALCFTGYVEFDDTIDTTAGDFTGSFEVVVRYP